MSDPEIVALLPMRAHSERVKDKNVRAFAGRPLYHHVLNTLLSCPEISRVVINTDSALIAGEAPRLFERVTINPRPPALCAGDVPMNEVLLYDVARISADFYLQTHSTNPLLRPETVSAAIRAFLASDDHDSLFGVTPLQTRLWWDGAKAVNHNPDVLLRTQDLPPIYEENSNIYIFSRAVLEARRNRIGNRPMMFPIARDEAWDIDEQIDFDIAEFLYRRRMTTGDEQHG